jgi:hypothetical protein
LVTLDRATAWQVIPCVSGIHLRHAMLCGIAVHDQVTSSAVHDCFGSEEVDLLTEQLEVYILRYECNTRALRPLLNMYMQRPIARCVCPVLCMDNIICTTLLYWHLGVSTYLYVRIQNMLACV